MAKGSAYNQLTDSSQLHDYTFTVHNLTLQVELDSNSGLGSTLAQVICLYNKDKVC